MTACFFFLESVFRISPRLSHHQHDENVGAITKDRGWKKIVKINIFFVISLHNFRLKRNSKRISSDDK